MAEGKKGFILYADLIHVVKKLPIEKRGELFTIILEYVNDENPKVKDMLIDLVFDPIKRQLKRDLKKYELRAEKSRENGRLGGRPKKPRKPSGLIDNLTEPRKPDIESVTVNDIDKGIDKGIESVIDIKTHPALISFRNNVFRESKEMNIDDHIALKFFEYWSAIEINSKQFLFQVTENFALTNKLKGWIRIEAENKTETFDKNWDYDK